MSPPNLQKPKFDHLIFGGGYDTETRPWNVAPGMLREAQNYEIGINNQGYRDIEGYEIYDGKPSPSDASYSLFKVTITGSFSVGDTITQLVSGATAVVLAVVTTNTPNELIITKITGTFDATNDLQVSAVTEGTALAVPALSGATTGKLQAQYLNLAADSFRSDISAVPGSGAILGVRLYNDVLYAFRNNAGGTEADLYKSSASGWTQVALGKELSFTSGGTYTIAEGDTITGATSGETAVITRVVIESGSLLAGDAAGRLIFASQSGAFQAENLDVGANLNVATIAADSTDITLVPGGRFEFIETNFGGEAGASRVYGCDGKNRSFEFDGTVFVPINAAVTTDTPTHIIDHKNHLFLSFAGSVQHSGIGLPYIFSPIFGAAELATGDIITGFMSEPGAQGTSTLGIYNKNRVHMLYGSSVLDWNLVKFKKELGAFEHTLQQFGRTIYLDDRGVTNLEQVQDFGNFNQATESRHIQTFLNQKRALAISSCIARNKNQYRLFFSDKSALYITTEDSRIVGFMPQRFNDVVSCVTSQEDSSGSELMFFGSTDGKVYQLDKGTSFDGDNIEALLKLHYNFQNSLRWIKRYLGVSLEASGDGYSEFDLSYELGYNSDNVSQPSTQSGTALDFTSAFWDTFVWDSFFWDGRSLSPSNLKLEGSAENISLVIRKNSDYFSPINLSGALIRYTFRRQLR